MAATGPAAAQTRLKLSSINPGTEIVVLVTNGDFQAQGTATSTNTHPNPTGWTRQADMFADPGTNLVAVNNGVVACALVNGGASVCQYKRSLTLEAATDYVLSAYLWNLGDGANHVTTVIDLKTVSLISPTDGTNIVLSSAPANLPIVASAADPDGTIAKVEYYAATTKLGETTAPAIFGTGANRWWPSGALGSPAAPTPRRTPKPSMAPTAAQLPAQGTFVPLNIDGQNLPSDWYLRLADQASRMLRREIPLQSQIPILP